MGLLWGYQAIVKCTLSADRDRSGGHILTRFKIELRDRAADALTFVKRRTAFLIACIIVGGCAGADVAVQSTRLPVPVVDPLPVSIGIHLSDDLRTYVHEETIANTGTFRINVGAAQALMFQNLATGLFSGHRFVASADDHATDIDAILVPSINELQFSMPKQTKSDFFEVWLNYNFELFGPEGNTIAEWPMKAYGRANSRNYGFLEDTESGALQEASRVALRDAMALFTFKFQRVPEVNQWLKVRSDPNATSPTPPGSEPTTTEAIELEPAKSEPSQTEGN